MLIQLLNKGKGYSPDHRHSSSLSQWSDSEEATIMVRQLYSQLTS